MVSLDSLHVKVHAGRGVELASGEAEGPPAAYAGLLRPIAAYCGWQLPVPARGPERGAIGLLRPVAAYCGLLRHIAAYCGLLRPIAAYCGLLRRCRPVAQSQAQ